MDEALLELLVAEAALTQLNTIVVYPRCAVVGYEAGAFQRGESVKVRRPKKRKAMNVDPRGAGLTIAEAEFFSADVTLDALWGDGFLTYSSDPSVALERYVRDTSSQMADGIATANDEYMYSKFREWEATTGTVKIGKHAPFRIVASLNSGATALDDFDNEVLRDGATVLDGYSVPDDGVNRFAILSTTAKNKFLGDASAFEGFAAAMALQSGTYIQRGFPQGQFIPRYGFNVTGSVVVTGQDAVADLDTASSTQATLPVASVAANTSFIFADEYGSIAIGAVDITLTAATALNVASGGVAVGQIMQIELTSGAVIQAFGVILRIASAGTTAPVITMVPCAPDGRILDPTEITTSMRVRVPSIPSVNTLNHREGLLMPTRLLAEPPTGSGARAVSQVDPRTGLLIQNFYGQYDIGHVRSNNAYYMLTGTAISDARKCVLALSK